jgi:HlyD family secretion protein
MVESVSLVDQIRSAITSWNRRKATIVGISAAVVLLILWSMRPQPVPADFAQVTRGDLTVTIDDEGETRVKDVYVVSAPLAGRVERIDLEVGDEVIAGETVLALFQPQDPSLLDARSRSEAQAGVGMALAEQSRAKAELDFAKADLARAEMLYKESTISAVTLDRARLAVKTAQAAVDQAAATVTKRRMDLETSRAALESAGDSSGARNANVTYISVRAPVSGRVLRRLQESEAVLPMGSPLLEVGNPTNLEVVTDLLSADAVKIKKGDPVIIDEWGGDYPLEGNVLRVEPFGFTKISALGVEEQRVNIITDFLSPPEKWASLGHGYRVMTRVIIRERPSVLQIPLGALFREGEDWVVFVNDGDEDGGRARLEIVSIGERNNLYAEVTGGLQEGDWVIVHPNDQVDEGVRIQTRESM